MWKHMSYMQRFQLSTVTTCLMMCMHHATIIEGVVASLWNRGVTALLGTRDKACYAVLPSVAVPFNTSVLGSIFVVSK